MAGASNLSWEDYFMAQACLSSRRSKDPNTQVGSSLMGDDHRIIGLGWNVFQHDPSGSVGNLKRESSNTLDTKYPYVMYSDMHAVMNKSSVSLKNNKMYTMMFPRALSTKILVQSGIKELVYLCSAEKYHDEKSIESSLKMLSNADVEHRLFKCKQEEIELVLPPYHTPGEDTREAPSYWLRDEEYFMYVACLASQRSKDPDRKVGACIVKPGTEGGRSHIVGIGYNGWPKGEEELYSWEKTKDEQDPCGKYPYVVHAEVNAILYKTTADLSGCTLYVTLSPCNQCATAIIESGIKEVVILNDKNRLKNDDFIAGRKMLDKRLGEEKVRVFDGPRQKLTINFKDLKSRLDKKRPPPSSCPSSSNPADTEQMAAADGNPSPKK